MGSLFDKVFELTGVPVDTLAAEAKVVFTAQGSIEYPFLVQELPSVFGPYSENIDKLLSEVVGPARDAFNKTAEGFLKPYTDVIQTLDVITKERPDLPIVALTDAPRYVAMWKLNKLGLLSYFDSVYGLADPKIPVDPRTNLPKVDPEILTKHLQQFDFGFSGRIRVLPEEYEKPGVRGLKTILMDYDLEDHQDKITWVGDNLRKDVGLGKKLGVCTAWAKYGTLIDETVKSQLLAFSPEQNVHKNVALDPLKDNSPQPNIVLESFSDLLAAMKI